MYKYDVGGRIHTRYLKPGGCAHTYWSIEGTDANFAGVGAATITTLFDAQDRPTMATFNDDVGRVVNQVILRYDTGGNLIEEESQFEQSASGLSDDTARGPSSFIRRFRYDARMRRIETLIPLGALGESRTTTSYNLQGDPCVEIVRDEHSELLADAGSGSEIAAVRIHCTWARYSYRYDHHMNWLQQVIEGGDHDTEAVIETLRTYRTITYFDAH